MTMTHTLVAPLVLSLDDPLDARLVGGKAAGLSRLLRLGVAVPRGVVIPASTSARFTAEDGIPDEDWCAIVGAWRSLDAPVVIVRSSAIGEDSAEASFAGQLDSIPDVKDAEGLRAGILRCWRSGDSDRVRAYERARGHALGGIGIVIQHQIDSSMSGVLFTKDPAGSDAALLEYCAGAGEDLVAGRINPGRAVVDAAGQVQHLAAADGASMADAALATLTAEGRRIADAFEAPQDIEWTIDADGHAWFVQARPITASATQFLPPKGGSYREGEGGSHGERQILWSNANVNENFPEPITPLLYSVAAAGYYHYFLNLGRAFGLSARRLAAIDEPLRQIIGVHGARMYYNLTSIHTVLRAAPFGEQLAAAFNQFVGADDIAPEEEGGLGWRAWRAVQALELARIAGAVIWQYLFLTHRVETFERTVDDYARRTEPGSLRRLGRAALRNRLQGFMEIRRHRWKNASLADAGSMVCYAALKAFLRRVLPGEAQDALHNTLLKALPGLVSSMPAIELWQLSRMIRADADLAALFATADPDRVVAAVRADAGFAPFSRAFDAYLDDWGFRCSAELMLTAPSFQENPAALVSILKSYAECDGESPSDLLARQQAERIADTKRVLERVGFARAIPLRVLLAWTQRSIQLRERARLKQALLYSRLRRVALAIGDDLCAEGRLERRDDVFMLTFDELDTLLAGGAMFPDHLAGEIRGRIRAHADLSAMRPPDKFVLAEGAYLDGSETRGTSAASSQTSDASERVGGSGGAKPPGQEQTSEASEPRERSGDHGVPASERVGGSGRAKPPGQEQTSEASEPRERSGDHGVPASERVGGSGGAKPPGKELTGTSACGGRATARATVLSDVTEAHKLHAGDILVTRQTDPGWGPVFPLISGLVMERGGMLSHGAIIAREFGIPSIVGVADATRLIPTGATVCLDADRGTVRLIRERASASEPRERSGDPGAPASARVGGSGGAKPPGSI